MLWMIRLVAVGVALFWLGVWNSTRKRRAEGSWRLELDAPVLPDLPPLRVIIPARNEAANIGPCLKTVCASDHPNLRITVFDDGSTDGTAAQAQAAVGGRALDILRGEDALPADWRGKTWALQRATRGVQEDWILFLDADVRVAPGALSRIHSYAVSQNTDFLSGFGTLTMESFWEKLVQPIIGGIIVSGNPLEKVNDDAEKEKVVANGQMILVRRESYEELGAHEAVKSNILEDVNLALHFRRSGKKMRVLLMRDLFSCRMYTNLSEIWLGWTKNFYVGLRQKPLVAAGLVIFLGIYLVFPVLLLLAGLVSGGEILGWGIGLWVIVQGVRAWLDRVMGQAVPYGVLQPLGALVVMGIVMDSMRRASTGQLVWKGRVYTG